MIDTVAGILVGVVLIIFVYSFLWKENIFFRTAEHIFIGVSFGITFVGAMQSLSITAAGPSLKGDWRYILPVLLGLLLFTSFARRFQGIKPLAWWSTIPTALIVATGFGVTIRTSIIASFYQQITSTANAFLAKDAPSLLNALIVLVAVICSIMYFTYTREHIGILKIPTRLGRLVIMMYFGATYGNVILTRMTLIIGIVYYIIDGIRTVLSAIVGG